MTASPAPAKPFDTEACLAAIEELNKSIVVLKVKLAKKTLAIAALQEKYDATLERRLELRAIMDGYTKDIAALKLDPALQYSNPNAGETDLKTLAISIRYLTNTNANITPGDLLTFRTTLAQQSSQTDEVRATIAMIDKLVPFVSGTDGKKSPYETAVAAMKEYGVISSMELYNGKKDADLMTARIEEVSRKVQILTDASEGRGRAGLGIEPRG